MRGLDPRIHVLLLSSGCKDVDGRVEPGHDDAIWNEHYHPVEFPHHAFTGLFAWLACGTPRLSDMCECVQSHASPSFANTSVARPGMTNADRTPYLVAVASAPE